MRCLRVRSQALHWLTMAAGAHRSADRFERALSSVDLAALPQVQLTYPAASSASLPRGGSIAVLDSSFNPPTFAHMHMLDAAAQRFGASRRLLLLAKQNADKPVVGASLVQRLQMMELLARDDATAATLCGVTAHPLFVDKASALRALCGPETTIYLLVGFDTWERIVDPKYYAPGGRDAAMASLFGRVEVCCHSGYPRILESCKYAASIFADCRVLYKDEYKDTTNREPLFFLYQDLAAERWAVLFSHVSDFFCTRWW